MDNYGKAAVVSKHTAMKTLGTGDKTRAFLTFILAAGQKTCFASLGFMQLFPISLIKRQIYQSTVY
jgi:hypothetical protein